MLSCYRCFKSSFILMFSCPFLFSFFFFNDTATTEIYTLSLHDALPISMSTPLLARLGSRVRLRILNLGMDHRSEEHTSELQSHSDLVCRLLLEKKKKNECISLRNHYAYHNVDMLTIRYGARYLQMQQWN